MSIRKKLIIALILLGVLPHILTGLYTYSLVDSIIHQESLGPNSTAHSIGWFFLVITAAGTVGFVILGIVLSREIITPIANILKHLKEVAPVEVPFDIADTGNELKSIELTINDVFDKLDEGRNELRKANLKLEEGNLLLTEQSKTLSVHNDLLYLIFSSNSMKGMGEGFLGKLGEYISLRAGAIFFCGRDANDEMSLVAGDRVKGDIIISAVTGLTKKVFETKKSMSLKWDKLDPVGDIAPLFEGMNPPEVLCSPILNNDMRVCGMLILGGDSFPDKDEELVNFAAFVLGMGLEKIDAEKKLQTLATDLRIKGEVLTTKNAELIELDSLRSEFVSLVSHELRTPLNAIIGFSEILLDAIAGELTEKQTECVRDILGSGLHLLQIVNDILDLSKIEAGYVDLEREKIDIHKEVMAVERTLSPIISKKSQKINIAKEDGLGEIVTDKGKLSQILLNLISNASKFSPDFSEININIRRKRDLIEFAIEDNGIGIAEKDIRLLFRPFVQIDSSHSRNYEGTGLGLVICKKMTETLGGTIRVESSPDSGSTFIFTVRDAVLDDDKLVSSGKERQSFFSKFEEEVRMGRLESLLSSKLVLMFKNGKGDADLLSAQLEKEGFEVVMFQDDQELLRASNMLSSDLVSLNFIHPDFDNNAIIDKLKKEPFISEVPLLVLIKDETETVMSESMGNAIKLGKNALKDVRFFV